MAHARLTLALALCAACGGAPKPVVQTKAPPLDEPPAFSAGARLGRFHSTRFGVSLPLPDGRRWRIDNHHAPVLRATHAPTQSLVEVAVWREDALVNRAACERRAHERGWAPEPAGDGIASEVTSFPPGWDTGVWLGADHDARSARGELVAFGAYVHKCLYFRFVTQAPLRDPDAISDRLAYVRLRVFGGLELDSLDVPRAPR